LATLALNHPPYLSLPSNRREPPAPNLGVLNIIGRSEEVSGRGEKHTQDTTRAGSDRLVDAQETAKAISNFDSEDLYGEWTMRSL
jgi:hypothetical protein